MALKFENERYKNGRVTWKDTRLSDEPVTEHGIIIDEGFDKVAQEEYWQISQDGKTRFIPKSLIISIESSFKSKSK